MKLDFFKRIFRNSYSGTHSSPARLSEPALVKSYGGGGAIRDAALDFIRKGMTFSFEDLRRASGASEYQLRKFFASTQEGKFRAWRQNLRISYACNLLRDLRLPIKEVARLAGYSDRCNFHRQFKKKYGISPREWRLKEFRDIYL